MNTSEALLALYVCARGPRKGRSGIKNSQFMRSKTCLLSSLVSVSLLLTTWLFSLSMMAVAPELPGKCDLASFSQSRLNADKMRFWAIGLSYREGFELLSVSAPFRQSLIDILKAVPYKAFFFEMPGVRREAVEKANFEFVVIKAQRLEQIQPDPHSFKAHFKASEIVSVFPNLGHDALLVSPNASSFNASSHLARFVREAPNEIVHDFFLTVAQQVLLWIANEPERSLVKSRPMWLSTSGTGVSWLHMRMDSVPKYYNHLQYTTPIEMEGNPEASALSS